MDFFEKLTKKTSDTCKTVAEKTNKIASETKLKMKIGENKSKINELYKEIGKKVYQKYALDGNLDIKADVEEELGKIKCLSDEIMEFERQILELSDMKECIQCKSKIEKKDRFCSVCGAQQPEFVDEAVVAEKAEEIKATDLPDSNEEIRENYDSKSVAEEVQQDNQVQENNNN